MGRMTQVFPTSDFKKCHTYRLLLPHAEEVIEFEHIPDEDKLDFALLLGGTASYISAQGNYGLAAAKGGEMLRNSYAILGRRR